MVMLVAAATRSTNHRRPSTRHPTLRCRPYSYRFGQRVGRVPAAKDRRATRRRSNWIGCFL